MAHKIVKDSHLAIFVKEVQVAAAGVAEANVPKSNDFIQKGAVAGLVGAAAHLGEDTAWYSTVDTAALIRVSGVTGTFADKAPVYAKGDGTLTGTATGNTAIGYADRPKTDTAAGDLQVQLVPRTGA